MLNLRQYQLTLILLLTFSLPAVANELTLQLSDKRPELASFSAVPGQYYRVDLQLAGSSPAIIELRYYDAAGQDIEKNEAALGFPLSTRQTEYPGYVDGQTVTLSISSLAGSTLVKPVQGRIWLRQAAGAPLQVLSLRLFDREADATVTTSGIVASAPTSEQNFPVNPVPNPSFEESTSEADVETVPGWTWRGNGQLRRSRDSYAGEYSLLLTSADNGGRAESDIFALTSDQPLRLFYFIKFSRFASPIGGPEPLRVEFYKTTTENNAVNSEQSFVKVNDPVYHEFPQRFNSKSGQWFALLSRTIEIPAGATHARLFAEHRDQVKIWSGDKNRNWGDIYIDNILLYQLPDSVNNNNTDLVTAEETMLSDQISELETDYSPYAPLFSCQKQLPFLPVGQKRENSLACFPARNINSNFIYAEDLQTPVNTKQLTAEFFCGNLLAIKRQVQIKGKLIDFAGQIRQELQQYLELQPYQLEKIDLILPNDLLFGAYYLELEFYDLLANQPNNEAIASSPLLTLADKAALRFAYLARRPQLNEAEYASPDNPFDLHPGLFSPRGSDRYLQQEAEARLIRNLGARGIRIQWRFNGFYFNTVEQAVSHAQKQVSDFRKYQLPLLKKYNIRCYLSLMEQGKNNLPKLPKTDTEWAAFCAYIETVSRELAGEIEFMLFGNEGLGGYTSHCQPDEDLFALSAFAGSTRDWLELYRQAYKAAKTGNPDLPFGPAQASDTAAAVSRQLFALSLQGDEFDCWGVNSYGSTALIAKQLQREVTTKRQKPFFGVIPEVGLGNVATQGKSRASQERMQALTLIRTYLETLSVAPWMRRIAWFTIADNDAPESHSIFANGPRPAAAVYPILADNLGAGQMEKHFPVAGGGDFYVWRRSNGQAVGIGYSSTGQAITLDVDGETLICQDMFGNISTLPVNDNMVTIQLSENPVYLLGATIMGLSTRYTFRAYNASVGAADQVALQMDNHTDQSVSVKIKASSHPLLAVAEPERQLELPANQSILALFSLQQLQPDLRRRRQVQFDITVAGQRFQASLADSFARCVRRSQPLSLQGDWTGWEAAQPLPADQASQVILGDWRNPDDVSAKIYTLWDEDYFYLGVQVTDNVAVTAERVDRLFLSDAIELGFVFTDNTVKPATDQSGELWQIVLGRLDNSTRLYRHLPLPETELTAADIRVWSRAGEAGNWSAQLAIPWRLFGGFTPQSGKQISFGAIIDDSDGQVKDRKAIGYFGSGIHTKQLQELGDLIFVE